MQPQTANRPSRPAAGRVASLREAAGEWFPFGLAPLLILAMTVAAGAYLLLHPAGRGRADLRMWTFANTHWDAYRKAAGQFARDANASVAVELVHTTAVTSRLRAAFWTGKNIPDLAEVEITWAGTFFTGPVEQIGFVDLRPYLVRDGLLDKIVSARLAPYTHRGRIFGVPHDVHPVMLAYRRDLFARYGIDANELTTWEEFIAAGRRVTVARGGSGDVYMINLAATASHSFEVFLFQRGGGYFNAAGEVIIDDDLAVDTLKWYTRLLAGPNRIAADPGMDGPGWVNSVQDGLCLTFICPDWKARMTELQVPALSGRMGLMPLPAFSPGGRRTSTWGGTMIGITAPCRDKDLAWRWLKQIYLDPAAAGKLMESTGILPSYREAWRLPQVSRPVAYWGGQRILADYARLADTVPAEHTSPYSELVKGQVGTAIANAVAYYRRRGEAGFDRFVRRELSALAAGVRDKQRRNPF